MNLFFMLNYAVYSWTKSKTKQSMFYINIFSFYHNHYVVDDELQKLWVIYDAYFICVLA